MPSLRLYNPSNIAAAVVSSEKYSGEARKAGARAVLRHGQHFTDYFATRSEGGLHPWYIGIHGLGAQSKLERKEIDSLINDSLHDTLDSISTLDWIDGGVSLLIHCPGYKTPAKFTVEDIAVDLYISPRELADGGTETSKAINSIVRSFGENIALPYLQRFQSRCTKEGVKAPAAPVPDASLKVAGKSAPVANNGPYVRCKCRQASSLAQDIAVAKPEQPALSSQRTENASQPPIDNDSSEVDIPVSEEWIREASAIAAQYDDPPVQSSSAIPAQDNNPPVQPSSAIPTQDNDPPVHPSSAIRKKLADPAAPHQNREDGFQGVIVSIGLHTDSVLDRFDLDDNLLPRLRALMQTVRSSRWEAKLRSPDFGLSYEQACKLSEAMKKDIGAKVDLQITKGSPVFYGSPIFLVLMTIFATIIAAFVAIPYI